MPRCVGCVGDSMDCSRPGVALEDCVFSHCCGEGSTSHSPQCFGVGSSFHLSASNPLEASTCPSYQQTVRSLEWCLCSGSC
mmetsp:Transcript_46976/g.105881  ORF Transcript_46976/g.105881 Transcript_46976/m.105881 type:complete len:81 (+) Transcript_46976:986-1228(+)